MKKILTSNGKILTENGKILTANVESGGGLIEVTELPEVGKANTVYKLIHKNVGTEVPTTGLIENVYLNTSLSIDEVNAILKTIEYIPATNEGEPDIYIVLQTLDSLVRIFDYNNGSYAIMVGMNVAYVSDESFVSAGATFVGWNPDLTNPCVVYQESTPTDDFVSQNDKLTELFSTTPFSGDSADYYIYEKGEPTQVPNSGLIENLYFNTKLSNEEVDAILSQLTYDTDGYAYVVGAYEKGSSYGNIIIVEANAFTQGQIPSGYIIGHMHDIINMASTEFIYLSNQGLVDLALTLGINTKVGWNMETLNLNQTFIGHYGTENDKLINVVSTTPYPRWTKISGGGATVKATPIAVPNSGYVERVYFNKSLSFDEVNAIVEKANSLVANELVPIYCVVSNDTFDKQLLTFKLTDHDGTTFNSIHYPNLGNVIWSERDYYNEEKDGSITQFKKGWMFEEDYVEINSEVVSFIEGDVAVNVGQHNDQLIELFSINNVFETNEIKVSGEYDGNPLVLSNKYVKKTVVPNEGYVERVYFNTALSIDEVKAIIEKPFAYVDGDTLDNAIWLINIDDFNNSSVAPEKLYWIMPSRYTGDYAIVNALAQVIFKSNSSKWTGGDFVGWNPEFITAEKPYLEINSQVFPIVTENGKEIKVGGFNDKIVDLFSLTPFEETIYDSVEVDIKEMLEEKKLPLSIKVNVESESVNVVKQGWLGTQVPNSGTVGNVYLNTALSVEEVDSYLDSITYTFTNEHFILKNEDDSRSIIIKHVTAVEPTGYYIECITNNTDNGLEYVYISSQELAQLYGMDFEGWNPNFNGVYKVDSNVVSTTRTAGKIVDVGSENDKLTSLFSLTPFTQETETVTLSGDYDGSTLETELVTDWQGTQVPGSGYIEKLYFNTNLSKEEVDNILSNINYIFYDGVYRYGVLIYDDNYGIYINYFNGGNTYEILYGQLGVIGSVVSIYSTHTGWADITLYEINATTFTETFASQLGQIMQNDKLSKLISTTPFTQENTINIKSLLEEKKLPLSIKVNVESQEPNLQEKEITENGEYVADEGYDGFSKVTVNVGGSSEDRLKKLLDARQSANYLFHGFKGKSVDDLISYSDTENVTDMNSMFSNCMVLQTIPQLDTSKVTNMKSMFSNCKALTEIPQLDMIKVSNTSSMFYNCSKLTNLTLLNIKVNLDLSPSGKLTLESLINTVKECINVGSAKTLTMGTANLSKIASTYVKFTDTSQTTIPTNEKGDVVVCESTDEGAMLLKDYALLKNWTLA